MAGIGPAPKHPSVRRRRNDPKRGFRVLSGVVGDVPAWPLQPDVARSTLLEVQRDRIVAMQVDVESAADGRTRARINREMHKAELQVAQLALEIDQARDAEVALWHDLWAMPQAELWRDAHALREVAQYVRWKIRAEQGDLKAAIEARQLSDRLGLNPLALLRLRAEVEHVDKAEREGQKRRAGGAPAKPTSKKSSDPRYVIQAVQNNQPNEGNDQ